MGRCNLCAAANVICWGIEHLVSKTHVLKVPDFAWMIEAYFVRKHPVLCVENPRIRKLGD